MAADKAGAKKAMSDANVEFKAGKYDAALEKYNEAVKLDPEEVQYVANRANVYLKLKKWQEAEDDCTAALKINSKYAKVRISSKISILIESKECPSISVNLVISNS